MSMKELPMTDLEQLKETFDKLRIFYKVENKSKVTFAEEGCLVDAIVLSINEGLGEGEGCTDFYFRPNGRFLTHGIWMKE